MANIPYPEQYDDSFMNIFKRIIDELNSMGYTYEEVLQKAHDILDEAQQTNDMNESVQQQINTLIAESGTSDAEVLQARIDSEGNEYDVLKTRLDEKEQNFNTQLAQIAYNVKSFGAKGDGETDDTPSIQNAIDTAYANGGGKVFIPKGNYNVTGIKLPSDIHLQGAGKGLTTLFMTYLGGEDTIANKDQSEETGNENITVTDMTIDSNNTGRSSTSYSAGIRTRYADTFHIENVYSKNSLGYGFDFQFSKNFTMQYCDASHCWDDGFSIADDTERGLIKFCNSWSNNDPNNGSSNKSGFEVEDGASYITFENCRAWDNEHQNYDIHSHEGLPDSFHITYKNCESLLPVLHHFNCNNAYNVSFDGINCQDTGSARGRFSLANIEKVSISKLVGQVAVNISDVRDIRINQIDVRLGEEQGESELTAFVLHHVEKVLGENIVVDGARTNTFQLSGDCEDVVLNDVHLSNAGEAGLRVVAGTIKRLAINNFIAKNCGQSTELSNTANRKAGMNFNAVVEDLSLSNITITDDQEEKTQAYGMYFSDDVNFINLTNINCRNAGTQWDVQFPNFTDRKINLTNIFADTIRYDPNA